jgi:hypothetical protein
MSVNRFVVTYSNNAVMVALLETIFDVFEQLELTTGNFVVERNVQEYVLLCSEALGINLTEGARIKVKSHWAKDHSFYVINYQLSSLHPIRYALMFDVVDSHKAIMLRLSLG